MSGPMTPETPSRESMAAIAAWMRSRRGLAPVDATRAPTKTLPTMSAGPESKRGGITGYDIPEPSLTSRALEAGASWLPPVDVPLAMRGAKKAIDGDMKGGAGMMALSMAGMVPAGKLLAKGAEKAGIKALEHELPRLSALHNTNADKLRQSLELGGMPVPSIAVVPEHIPFDEFGDITLIGKRSLGDPATSRVFSDDVYSPTVPDPSFKKPKRTALQEAWKKTTGQYGDRYGDDVFRYAEDGDFAAATRNAYRSDELTHAWAKARGIQGDTRAIRDAMYADPALTADYEQFVRTAFEPFMRDPSVKIGSKTAPYELDNVAQAMSGNTKNAQQTMVYGPGKVRSSHATQFKDLEKMRAAATEIRPREETLEPAKAARQKLVDAAGELAPYSPFRQWQGMDDAMKAFSAPKKTPLEQSLARVDIRNVPPETVASARASRDEFLSVPPNYFESKPARGVRFNEFAGAVVPQTAPDDLVNALKAHGLAVERYSETLSRPDVVAKLRKALAEGGKETLFSALVAVGMGGAIAGTEQSGQP